MTRRRKRSQKTALHRTVLALCRWAWGIFLAWRQARAETTQLREREDEMIAAALKAAKRKPPTPEELALFNLRD